MTEFSVFDYLYRDGSNYKAWGSLLLKGKATQTNINALLSCLENREFFIAEQVGIPPVYAELWECSGGPTEDDHVWHTFLEIRPAKPDEANGIPWGTVSGLIKKFKSVQKWDESLSPNWDIPRWCI